MASPTRTVTTREMRVDLAQVIGRVEYAHERIGITRHGKLAAVVIGIDDLELLEELELLRDSEEFARAKAEDDGARISLDELRAELG